MSFSDWFSLLGGVGLFLFGMTIMSAGLRHACGENLQSILEHATKNKIIAVFVGLGMTMLIQSSSATDVMVIGFVNSGMMSLSQAIGVIMGANIGTTITAQITAFNLSNFAPLLLFVGAVMYLFLKKNLIKHIGGIIMGFGMLFQGIIIMKAAIVPLAETPGFSSFLSTMSNPVIALLFGIGFTALLQSSSSATVIFQAFAVQGLLTYDMSVYLIIGAAIGSVTPNLLAGLTANREGKRTSILNLLFNLIRAAIIIIIINVFPGLLLLIQAISPGDVGRQIANTHTIFAVIAVVIEIFFTRQIIAITYRFIPLKGNEQQARKDRELIYMNQLGRIPPALAISQTQREITRMGEIAYVNLRESIECFFDYDDEKAERVRDRERNVDILNHSITDAMTWFREATLSGEQMRRISMMTITITDIERLSDHAENIVEYIEQLRARRESLSEEAAGELRSMSEDTLDAVALSLKIFSSEDYSLLDRIEALEDRVDRQEDELIGHHTERLMHSKCTPLAGIIFSDIVTDFERCSDHAINIAYSLKERKLIS